MSRKDKLGAFGLLVLLVLIAAAVYLHSANIPVLEPRGEVGQKERELIFIALGLAAIVVVPVFTMLFLFSWKYREGNQNHTKYEPDWDHSRRIEAAWWLIPAAIIAILSVVAWNSSHVLDPYKPLSSRVEPLDVEVVALDWKWLFIYPKQNIATVNFVQLPINTPINFEITSDAVMNSFWIPQLGGQIYAMPGMSTQLHLMADQTGNYVGRSANISGRGFAGMNFTAEASSQSDFKSWVQLVKRAPDNLSFSVYNKLSQPSQNNPVAYYSSADLNIYDTVIMKYMGPDGQMSGMGM